MAADETYLLTLFRAKVPGHSKRFKPGTVLSFALSWAGKHFRDGDGWTLVREVLAVNTNPPVKVMRADGVR